ncbi:MAG: helix-turn-helix transcriptional regulator [Pseudoxanthomonas sp.]
MNPFGARLKHFREARCWSQEQLGFELEISKATVSKWESGQALPRWENLPQLRRLLAQAGLTLDYLIDGAEDPDGMAGDGKAALPTGAVRSADELALLMRFRALKPGRRKGLMALLAE